MDPDNLVGGYATAFDLVSMEYGWTDDQIMELPVSRFRQIVAAIHKRNYMRRRDEISLISWQTRQLASFIAGGYMTDGENPVIEMASELAFDEIEKEQIEEAKIREIEKPIEAKPGSFERFMSSFGSPKRWK